jgi:hypothetical protein
MMKIALSMLLLVTLILSVIGVAGCGGKSDSSTTQTSTTASTGTSTIQTTTSTGSSSTNTSSITIKTTSVDQGTGDLWSDVPIYPNAQKAEDEGFELSVPGDPSYSQIEWHFFATSDDFTKVVDYYKQQMQSNGWTKTMWADIGEMSYGTFQKNNETRMCLVYVIKGEDGTAINIMSAAK